MNAGSLFSGIEGIGLGLQGHGVNTIWHCEYDPPASSVLARHYPNRPNLGDITKVKWEDVEPVELLHGGFPCQDISFAGAGAGMGEGTRSGLWSFYADAIRVLRPRYVFVENVSALAVRGLTRVLGDLAALGFDAEWTTVRASDVGAPHRRERIFILAVNTNEERLQGPRSQFGASIAPGREDFDYSPAASNSDRCSASNTDNFGRQGRPWTSTEQGRRGELANGGDTAAHPNGERFDRWAELDGQPPTGSEVQRGGHADGRLMEDTRRADMGAYEPAIKRWEQLTRPAPSPTDDKGRLNPDFVEWMMGFPQDWTAGIPRSERLKCLGNAVVPQCASVAYSFLIHSLESAA